MTPLFMLVPVVMLAAVASESVRQDEWSAKAQKRDEWSAVFVYADADGNVLRLVVVGAVPSPAVWLDSSELVTRSRQNRELMRGT